jgi:membrane-bound serine protease (ClpP class)
MRRLLIAIIASAALLAIAAPAAPAGAGGRSHVDVVEVAGLIDPIQVDFIDRAVSDAEDDGAEVLVVQLNSGGGVVPERRLEALAERLRTARVPVAIWVGPNGSRAVGPPFRLLLAAPVSGMAPGTRVGNGSEPSLGTTAAVERGLVDLNAPTLGDFVVSLDGRTVGGRTLDTAEVVLGGEQPRRQLPSDVEVRLTKPGLLARLLHTAASPSVAYLLLVAGLSLVVFELYTAGIGVAAVTAAGCLVLSCYGLAVLPTRPWSVGLILVAMFGYAVDVQAGAARAWTAIATLLLVAASFGLYDMGLAPSPVAVAAVVSGTVVLMVAGMPAAVRARFSTPTIGRESMVGEMGEAVAAVDPEGTVEVRGARWKARTNRATPVAAGEAVRVVGIDGLLLEVEPETGGARDSRRH